MERLIHMFKRILSFFMMVIFIMGIMFVMASEPKTIADTRFYVYHKNISKIYQFNNDRQFYTYIGYGEIIPPDNELIYDVDAVTASIVTMPDISTLGLTGDEEIYWYRLWKNTEKNEWWIFGEIIDINDPIITAVYTESIRTRFMLLNRKNSPKYRTDRDPQYYTYMGYGEVIPPNKKNQFNTEAVMNSIITLPPDISSVELSENETIEWYRVYQFTKTNEWWIFGEIVEISGHDSSFLFDGDESEGTFLDNYDFDDTTLFDDYNDDYVNDQNENDITEDEINPTPTTVPTPSTTPIPTLSPIPTLIPILTPTIIHSPSPPPIPASPTLAPPTNEPETLRELLYHWLTTGNSDVHDISKFNLNLNEVNKMYTEMVYNEGFLAYRCNLILTYITTKENGFISTLQYKNIDSQFLDRYSKSKATVDHILNMTDVYMTDIDKVLFAHEFLVSRTVYQNKDEHSRSAVGPLAYGYGVCGGFAYALSSILYEMGIESQVIISSSMNHGWNLVKLDGNWYHIDPTWDNTKSPNRGTDIYHNFFLRSDNEFKNDPIAKNRHYGWDTGFIQYPKAEKPYISNWFVHSYVGQMYYEKGGWYYIHEGDIVRSKLDGTQREVLVKAQQSQTMKVTGQTGNGFSYTVNGTLYHYDTSQLSPLN